MAKAKIHAKICNDIDPPVEMENNESIIFELSTFGKRLGEIFFDVQSDLKGNMNMYIIKYHPDETEDYYIIEEGHKKEGLVQRMSEHRMILLS